VNGQELILTKWLSFELVYHSDNSATSGKADPSQIPSQWIAIGKVLAGHPLVNGAIHLGPGTVSRGTDI
jgi:hypothetical protein